MEHSGKGRLVATRHLWEQSYVWPLDSPQLWKWFFLMLGIARELSRSQQVSTPAMVIVAFVWRLRIDNKELCLIKGMLKLQPCRNVVLAHIWQNQRLWPEVARKELVLGRSSPFLQLQKYGWRRRRGKDQTCLCLNLWSLSEGYNNI